MNQARHGARETARAISVADLSTAPDCAAEADQTDGVVCFARLPRIIWDDEITTGISIGPLFRKDMRYDPRYGVVPTVTEWPLTGEEASPVEGFWSTFTYHVYTSTTKVKASTAGAWTRR